MFCLEDTIFAKASSPGPRTIIRVTGPNTLQVCQGLTLRERIRPARTVIEADLAIESDLDVKARLYVFPPGSSYTGQPTIEIHIEACPAIVNSLLEQLARSGARPAQPGEFTARAFLMGKMDLAAAEAVNQLILATNNIKKDAAMRLIKAGTENPFQLAMSGLLEVLATVEAGIDFGDESLGPISREQILAGLRAIIGQLSGILDLSTLQQRLSVMPSIGLAGLPNTGKSTLFNRLCNASSIVSAIPGTTRDILEAVLDLDYHQCILFDCPGLDVTASTVLDQLVYQTAIDAIRRSDATIFCVDVAKLDYQQDLQVSKQVGSKAILYVATKADLLDQRQLDIRLAELKTLFQGEFLAVSGRTGLNIGVLRKAIERLIWPNPATEDQSFEYLATSARMQQAIRNAIDNLTEAVGLVVDSSDELAAIHIRSAYQALSDSQAPIDEQILERIFSRFCIGK